MKKKWIMIAVVAVLLAAVVTAAVLLIGGNGALSSLPDTSEEVRLGAAYEIAETLTAADGTEYTVEQAEVYRNSNGKEVLQIYGVFDVDDILGYKIVYTAVKGEERVTQTHKLVVVDEGKPVMFVNGSNVAEVGEKYIFPSVTVKDNSKAEIPCTIEVYKSAQTPVRMEQDADGFIPDEVGYYELHLSAEDSSGNQASAVFTLYARHTRLKTEIDAFDDEGLYYTAHAVSGTNKENAELSAFSRLTSSKGSAYFRSGSGDETTFYMKPRNEASVMELVGDDGYISVWMYIATMRNSSKTVKYGNTSLALDTNVWQEIRITPEIVGPWPAYFAKLTSYSVSLFSVVNDGEDYTVFIDDVFAVKNNGVVLEGLTENKTYSAGDQVTVSAVDGAVCEYYHAGNAEVFTDSFVPKSEGKYMITVYSSDRTALSAEQITVGTLESQVKTTEWYMKNVQFQVPELNVYDGNRKIEAQTATWLVDIASGERTELEDTFVAETDIIGLYSESVFDGRTTALFRIISMNDTDFDTWFETDDPQAAQMTNKWDNLQVSWLEEYDGEKGVVAIENTTGKEGYFTNRNFWKVPYGKEHYKRVSKLVFKMKVEGEKVRLAYVSESPWISLTVTNDAENGWQEYAVDFDKIYENFDSFNSRYIFWTDSSKQTPYTLYISDVYAVIEDELDAVTISAGQSYNIAEHPSFDGCEITECTVTKGGSYVAVSGTTFRTGSSGMYKVTVCGYDHMGLYFENTFVVDAVGSDVWNDFNDPAVAEVPKSTDTTLSWLESYDGAEGVLKIVKGKTVEQYVGNSDGINFPAAFEKSHYKKAIGLSFRVKLESNSSTNVGALGRNFKGFSKSLLTGGLKPNSGWQDILIELDVYDQYDMLNGLFFYLSSQSEIALYIDKITVINASDVQEPDNMWHSFSTPFSASVAVSSDSSASWLSEYDGASGVLKIEKGKTVEQYIGNTDGINWKPAFDKEHYKNAIGLSFRVKLESNSSTNVVALGRNFKGFSKSLLTGGLKPNSGWQDILVELDVYEQYDMLNGLFFYLSSQSEFTLYIDEITVIDASDIQEPDNMWYSFSTPFSAAVWNQEGTTLTWHDSFDGKDGVLQIDKTSAEVERYIGTDNGENWKAVFDKAHYEGAVGLSFRIRLVSEKQASIAAIGKGWGLSTQTLVNNNGDTGWIDVEVPYDVYNDYDKLNGLFFYTSSSGNWTLYLDQITAIYEAEEPSAEPTEPTEPSESTEPENMWYGFSDASCADVWKSDRVTLTWLESYDGADGVLQVDKPASDQERYLCKIEGGSNFTPVFPQDHYEGAVGLRFRVKLVSQKQSNIVAFGKNWNPSGKTVVNSKGDTGWIEVVIPYDVYTDYDALSGMFFYMSSSDAFTLYFDEITVVYNHTVSFSDGVEAQTVLGGTCATEPTVSKNGYCFKGWYNGDTKFDFSTPITSDMTLTAKWEEIPDNMWFSFGNEAASTAIWINSDRASLTWHESYDGEDGVLQIDKTAAKTESYIGRDNGINWVAEFDREHYQNAVALSFRVKLVSEKQASVSVIGKNWSLSGQSVVNSKGDTGWVDVVIPYDVYTNYDLLNGLFFYTSSSGAYSLYIDEITVVYDTEPETTEPETTEPETTEPETTEPETTEPETTVPDNMWFSFSDEAASTAIWVNSDRASLTWHESYDGEDGVLQIDKTAAKTESYVGSTNGNNWVAEFDREHYKNAVALCFRVKLVSEKQANIVAVGKNWGLSSQTVVNSKGDTGWIDVVIPYDVYDNYDVLNGLFLYTSSSGAYSLYIDEITVVEEDPFMWYSFGDASCTNVWKSDGVALTWLDSFDGEDGVLQVDKPSSHIERYLCKIEGGSNFTPVFSQEHYKDAVGLRFRIKLVSEKSVNVAAFGKNWTPSGKTVINKSGDTGWVDVVIPYDVYTDYEALSGMFFYMSSSGAFTLYFDEITVVYNHTVSFSDGVESQTVQTGSLATEPAVTKEGYTFLGWYDGDTKFDFTQPITSDVTLTAKWEASPDSMWYSFSDETCTNVWTSTDVTLTWLDSYDGEAGVLKIDKGAAYVERYLGDTNKTNWQAEQDKEAYKDATGLCFRVKLVSERSSNVVVLGKNWGLASQSLLNYGLTANSGWHDVVIPYDVYENYDLLNGLFFYLSSQGAFTLYIDQIIAV